jgi:serine/threonine protein kinase
MARFAPAIERLASKSESERTLGAFQLVHPLGKGGFAPVWLAREVHGTTELRTVAIKLFADSSEGTTSRERERIVEEARALCRVEHPNVVRFHALHADAEKGVVGLVMEYVRGTSLDTRIRSLAERGEKMPIVDVLSVGVATASALASVHQAGLVHRDIKPANIVEASGVFKVIDFGIAAAEKAPRARPTGEDAVMLDGLPLVGRMESVASSGTLDTDFFAVTGTVGYIDPHCIATASAASSSSDLYALGATLFECIVGKVPAAAAASRSGAYGLSAEVLDGRAQSPPLLEIVPALPAPLAKLVDQLLEASPSRRPRSAEAVAWELERIRREVAGRSRPLPPEEVGPFRGLGRFEPSDRDVYFGRSVEIAASLEMIRSRGLLALIGPSGSGKSSLARAGVLPAIADGDLGGWPKAWDTLVVTPGADARASITKALAQLVDGVDDRAPEAWVDALSERAQSSERGVVLLIDQLEELVTVSAAESRAFVAELLAHIGAQPLPGVRAIVAARRDLLDALLDLPGLGRALTRGTLLVSPMSKDTWGDVVDHALAAYGYALEDTALRVELLAQLSETASAMPLVQFALTQLWERRDREKRIVPRAALDAIGGIAGALEMHANATLAHYAEQNADAVEAARRVLLAMTTSQGTRRARAREELAQVHGLAAAMLERLEGRRLVVQEPEGLTIAHEALLSRWTKLRTWIAATREERLFADRLEQDALDWIAQRDPDRLWKKRHLLAAEDLVKSAETELSDGGREFVRASVAARSRKRYTIAAALVFGTLVLALLGYSIGGYAVTLKEAKERVAKDAVTSGEVAQALQDCTTQADELIEQSRECQSRLARCGAPASNTAPTMSSAPIH